MFLSLITLVKLSTQLDSFLRLDNTMKQANLEAVLSTQDDNKVIMANVLSIIKLALAVDTP